MDLEAARQSVIRAFDPVTMTFYHRDDYRQTDFIDGMAWIGLLVGAAKRYGDKTLTEMGTQYLKTLCTVGPNARNYARSQVNDKWVASPTYPGYWYYPKPQAFAGPAGLYYAGLGNKPAISKILMLCGWLYGLVHPLFDGYQNSIMTAYLINDKKPPTTLAPIYLSNPFYAAIAGVPMVAIYPDLHRCSNGMTKLETTIQQLALAEPSAWIFRRNPYNQYIPLGERDTVGYVPTAQVVGSYLQGML